MKTKHLTPVRTAGRIASAHCVGWLTALLLSLGFAARAQLVIDDFSTGHFEKQYGSEVLVQTGDPAHLFGGQRQVAVYDPANPILPRSSIELAPGSGKLAYERNRAGSLSLGYGYFAGNLVNADLQGPGYDRFEIVVTDAPGPFILAVYVRDNSFWSRSASTVISGDGPGRYSVPFSSFSDPAFEWDKFGGFRLSLNISDPPWNGPGLYGFGGIYAVPEPRHGALVLAAFALSGALWRRLRR